MDGSSFDRIARALGAGVSRRSGLLGALGAALTGVGGVAAGGKGNGKGKNTGHGGSGPGPGIAGPCGKGKKKNLCKQNSDCCTNICKTQIKNKDRTGRCRCEKKGRPCSEDRNCCGSISCVAGKCGGKAPMVATGAACGPNDVCRDPNAECTTYDYDTPAGTYCLMPPKGFCASGSDCASSQCAQGLCRPCSSPACAGTCTPIVCASCTYQTVQAAIDAAADGDVIAIGKGTYVENLTIGFKALTLRACPGERVTLRNALYGSRTIFVLGGTSLTVLDITIDGYQDLANSNNGGGIESDGSLTLAGTTVVRNAGWSGSNFGAGVKVIGDDLTVTLTDDVVLRDNHSGWGGAGIYVQGKSDLVITGWVAIADNISDSYGGGVMTGTDTNLTISGHTRITGNSSDGYAGGGVSVFGNDNTRATTVTVKDDVVIADNLCISCEGGGLQVIGKSTGPVTASITDRVQIIGNTADDSYGGGIAFQNWVKATISGEVEISGNRARFGGGVGAAWIPNDRPGDWVHVTITDSARVIDNVAEKDGGGIQVYVSAAEVTGSAVISGNTAERGGGVLLDGGAHPAMMTVSGEATITGNTATNSAPSGGGVWSDDNANTLTAVTGSITGNTPDQCAGGTISC